eukprot:6486863-Amphidinium_carterae.1
MHTESQLLSVVVMSGTLGVMLMGAVNLQVLALADGEYQILQLACLHGIAGHVVLHTVARAQVNCGNKKRTRQERTSTH